MSDTKTVDVLAVTPEQQAQIEAAFRLCSGGARKITGAWVKRFDACVESILGFQPPATYMLDTSAGASA